MVHHHISPKSVKKLQKKAGIIPLPIKRSAVAPPVEVSPVVEAVHWCLVWRAHEGQGAAYVAIDEDSVEYSVWRKMCQTLKWHRRDGDSLPGLENGLRPRGEKYFVAEATKVGVLDLPNDSFVVRYGPRAIPADHGHLVELYMRSPIKL